MESCRPQLRRAHELRTCFSLMDNHTLLQQFRYILSLASLAYTFTTIHTLQYAMNNNNCNRNHNITTQPIPGPSDQANPSASAPSSSTQATPSTTSHSHSHLPPAIGPHTRASITCLGSQPCISRMILTRQAPPCPSQPPPPPSRLLSWGHRQF